MLRKSVAWLNRLPPFYPFLFGIFPILNILASGLSFEHVTLAIRPTLLMVLGTAAFLFLARLLLKDLDHAAAVTSLILFFSFYYGSESKIPDQFNVFLAPIGVQLLVAGIVVGIILFVAFNRRISLFNFARIRPFLNLLSSIWLIVPVFQVGSFVIEYYLDPYNTMPPPFPPYSANRTEEKPDIYYIILDGYTRQDVLEKIFHYDNSEFTRELNEMGFYVADQSRANYHRTVRSLSSSLNSEYLDYLSAAPESKGNSHEMLLFEYNRLSALLGELGYTRYAFNSFGPISNPIPKEVELKYNKKSFLTSFETTVLNYSFIGHLLDLRRRSLQEAKTRSIPYDEQRKKIRFVYSELENLTSEPSPKFVFAHVVAPHPPFVFDKDGEPIYPDRRFTTGDGDSYQGTDEEYLSQYPDQLEYINKLTLAAVKRIISKSKTPPVIILQGDHGSGVYLDNYSLANTCVYERFSILNAYYGPQGLKDLLYPEITPVNSFRLILDYFFDTRLGLLPDKVIYGSLGKDENKFFDVTDQDLSDCTIN
jgi:hypothetical protein